MKKNRQKFLKYTFVKVFVPKYSRISFDVSDDPISIFINEYDKYKYINGTKYEYIDAIIDQSETESDCELCEYERYSIWIIENGKVVRWQAWYDEENITALPEQDIEKAARMIYAYCKRQSNI